MNANNANKGDAEPDAEPSHEHKKVQRQRRMTFIDALIYGCGALVLIGGTCIGYLGVSGSLANQRILALKIVYGTLFFILTGAFLYFYQNLKNAPPDRAYMGLSHSVIVDFKRGESCSIILTFKNGGKPPAEGVWIATDAAMAPPDWQLNWTAKGPPAGEAGSRVLGGDVALQNVELPPKATGELFDSINEGKLRVWIFGKLYYRDENGTPHCLQFCRFYKPGNETLTACHEYNRELY